VGPLVLDSGSDGGAIGARKVEGQAVTVIRRRVVVDGVVQGVFFRASVHREAVALGVSGWVRNLADGSVEAVFEGPAPAVDAAVEWCRHGPDRAAVTSFDVTDETPEGLRGFSVR
jgi:acylphosphatase